MHELSVALEVCRMAEERLGPEGSSRLRVIGLHVGDDAGFEPENLEFCLDVLLSQPPFGAGRVDVTRRPGTDLRVDYFEVDDGDPDD